MAALNTFCTREEYIYTNFEAAVDVDECFKQVEFSHLLHNCAPARLPSYLINIERRLKVLLTSYVNGEKPLKLPKNALLLSVHIHPSIL